MQLKYEFSLLILPFVCLAELKPKNIFLVTTQLLIKVDLEKNKLNLDIAICNI